MQTFKLPPHPFALTPVLVLVLVVACLLAPSSRDAATEVSSSRLAASHGTDAVARATRALAASRATNGVERAPGLAGGQPLAPGAVATAAQAPAPPIAEPVAAPLPIPGPHQQSRAVDPPPALSSRTPSTGTRRTAQAHPPNLPALAIGIDGGYADWSDGETAQRAALGAAVTRHEWDPLEPVDDQDDVVYSAAAEIETRIHALLGANQLGDASHYRDWTIAFIRRYGLGGAFWDEHPELDEERFAIRTFELGNEPYFGEMSPELYADTVRPALEEIDRLGLPVNVVLPSRVYGTDTSWLDTLYARIPDLNSLFYAFADHPYWYGHDPEQVDPAGPFGRIAELRRRMNAQGAAEKPIFITEYGQSTASCGGECVSEADQAAHLSKMLSAAITRTEWKVEMISVFQLLDRGTESGDRELQFGLLREDGTPKPSYSIVRDLMQQYRG